MVVCLWAVRIVVGKVISNNSSNSRFTITEVTSRINISLTTSSNSNNNMVLHIHKEATIITTVVNIILKITTYTSKINNSNTMVVITTTATMIWVVISNKCKQVVSITVEISIMEVDSTTVITTIINIIEE